jgi:hypothetical protein
MADFHSAWRETFRNDIQQLLSHGLKPGAQHFNTHLNCNKHKTSKYINKHNNSYRKNINLQTAAMLNLQQGPGLKTQVAYVLENTITTYFRFRR